MIRVCPYCGIEFKPLFSSKIYCCREHKERARTKRKKGWTDRNNKRRFSASHFLEGYKTTVGCEFDCPVTDHRCLQFHHLHRSEKSFTISRNLQRPLPTLVKEIEKCVVLCANCHLIIEHLHREGLHTHLFFKEKRSFAERLVNGVIRSIRLSTT